tara:strand:- start:156 stop:1316 length:1161 start_codon:yes stop_codon:yes gene_type:complete
MKNITLPSINLKQNGSTITLTTMTAKELIKHTQVQKFNSDLALDDPNQGYQRKPGIARIKKLGNFLDKTIKAKENFPMPTAILLSDRGCNVTYDSNTLSFDNNTKFNLIDGQHRVLGLRHAIEQRKNKELEDHQFSVVVLRGLDRLEEMNQFRVVNGTAKSVNTALVNMMLAQIATEKGDDAIDNKVKWKVIASKVVKMLNEDKNSVWYDKFIMPEQNKYTKEEIKKDPKKKHLRIATATSFVNSLQRLITYLDEFIWFDKSIDFKTNMLIEILESYWGALSINMKPAFENSFEYVIQKSAGIFSLHWLLKDMVTNLWRAHQSITHVNSYEKIIEGGHYEWISADKWKRYKDPIDNAESAAAYGSMKGFDELYKLVKIDLEENRPK